MNGCRQNESPNSWLKHHNNPQVIHTTPVYQLMSVFVINKLQVLYPYCFLQWKCLNQERNMNSSSTVYKWKQSKTNVVYFDVRGQHGMEFCTGGNVIMDGILARSDGSKVKIFKIKVKFVSYKHAAFHFTRHYWQTEVMWIIVMFLSVVSTLTLTAHIHCRGSNGEQLM